VGRTLRGLARRSAAGEVSVSRRGVGSGTPAPKLVSALRRRLGEAVSGFDALPFDGAVDRGAADSEEFGDFERAVFAAVD
jgi:hypothetical protein